MQTVYGMHNIILFDNTLDLLGNLFQYDETAHLSKDFSRKIVQKLFITEVTNV